MTSLIPVAIRWDAYSAFGVAGDPTTKTQHFAGFAQYRGVLPWWQTDITNDVTQCIESQVNMDQEILLAKQAGIKCWAYNWFTPASSTPMMAAWRLHQSSIHANNVNWCPSIGFGTFIGAQFSATSTWHANMAAWATYMQMTNYQKVLTNRPLVMINFDDSETAAWFSGSLANIATMITYLNGLLTTAGLGNAYFVLMGSQSLVSARATSIGSGVSALGAYSLGSSGNGGLGGAYSGLTTAAEGFWTSFAGSGFKYVPTAMSGWSPQARRERPPSFEPQSPFANYNKVFTAPTPSQLATHLQDAITFIGANASVCESGVILIYAWSECDESGNPMMPTQNDPPINVESGQANLTSNLLIGIGPTLRAVA